MADPSPEIVGLLDVLKDRDKLDEMTKLFEASSDSWQHLSEDERSRLVARAMALMSDRNI